MNGKRLTRPRIAAGLAIATCLPSCGRYSAPRPPEFFSPRAVRNLETSALAEGVKFKWEAPDEDRRGRELKSMTGYYVLRKPLELKSDAIDPSIKYVKLAEVEDKHVAERERLRDEARAKGELTRRVKVPEELSRFEYLDKDVKPGQSYLYKIVPVNQGDAEGEVKTLVRVAFQGEGSQITNLENTDAAESDILKDPDFDY